MRSYYLVHKTGTFALGSHETIGRAVDVVFTGRMLPNIDAWYRSDYYHANWGNKAILTRRNPHDSARIISRDEPLERRPSAVIRKLTEGE